VSTAAARPVVLLAEKLAPSAVALLGDITSLFSGAVPGGRFYRAILVEQAVGWAALFGLAHLLLALDARRSIPD